MKKTLLLSAMMLLAIVALNAQATKIWNLGGDPTVATGGAPAFPTSTGIGLGDNTTGNPAFPVNINGLLTNMRMIKCAFLPVEIKNRLLIFRKITVKSCHIDFGIFQSR